MRNLFKIILNKRSIEEVKEATSCSCVRVVKEYIKHLNSNIKIDRGVVEISDGTTDKIIGYKWKIKLLDKKSHLKLGWTPSVDKLFFLAEIISSKDISQSIFKEYIEDIQYNLEVSGFYCKVGNYDEWNTDDNFYLGHYWTLECVDSFDSLLIAKLLG